MSDSDSVEQPRVDRATAIEQAGGTWPAKRELASALRELLDSLCGSGASDEEIRSAAAEVRSLTRPLADAPPLDEPSENPAAPHLGGMHDYMDRGPMCGLSNPVAPPMTMETNPEAHAARGELVFGNAYEGAPGCVHGGFVASAFDEMLGVASSFSGAPCMTGEFTVRYRHPTPINTPLRIEARFTERRGRRIFTEADMFAGETRVADARGLFIVIPFDRFGELEQERSESGR